MLLLRQTVFWYTLTNSGVLLSTPILFISMAKVESAPLYMTNQKQAHFFSLSLSPVQVDLLFGYIVSLSSNTGLARSSPSLKQRFFDSKGDCWLLAWMLNNWAMDPNPGETTSCKTLSCMYLITPIKVEWNARSVN